MFLLNKLKILKIPIPAKSDRVILKVYKMKDKFKVEIDMEQEMCFSCKKISPEYYQLKLQLRYLYFNDLLNIKKKNYKNIKDNEINNIKKISKNRKNNETENIKIEDFKKIKNYNEIKNIKIESPKQKLKTIDEIKNETMTLIEKNFNTINKLQELDNGFDVFFRTKNEMNKLSTLFQKRYLIEEKRSKKIVGHNFLETKDIWRHILLINIVNLEKGDLITIKGEEFNIKALNHNDLILINSSNGSKKVVAYKLAKDYLKLISKREKN